MYQSKGRGLHSKDSKQLPGYLRAVNKHLIKNRIYQRIGKLIKSEKDNHKEAEEINEAITQATQYGEQQSGKKNINFWDFDVQTLKMKKAFWCYLIARNHFDITVICAATREEGVEMYNTPTPEALKIVQQLRADLKKHYQY